jgi:hypothetical protein
VRRVVGGVVELTTGCDIVVAASDYRSIRGRTAALVVFNEVAFWRDESGRYQNPDAEIYSAVLPSLMTLRRAGSMLIGISSVHRKIGLLYEKVAAHVGTDHPHVLAIRAPSVAFNPTIDQADIDIDVGLDPDKARAEWLSEWRTDISGYIDRALVEALVDRAVRERPYDPAIHTYVAFADEAGGSGQDASTLCVVHTEQGGLIVQDLMRVWKPPFSPSAVMCEKATLVRSYKLGKLTGDRWAGGLPPDAYRQLGLLYDQAEKPKSDYYLDFLSILNSRRIRLLDEPMQLAELCNLERRVRWGGRETIDHSLGAHDDAANALAGCAVLAATSKVPIRISPAALARSALPGRFGLGYRF